MEKIEKLKKEEIKPRFEEALRARIKELEEMGPFFSIEALRGCSNCDKEISLNSTDYYNTGDRFFCGADCYIKGPHSSSCFCEICGTQEEFERLYNELREESKKVHGMTGGPYAHAAARIKVREKYTKIFLEKHPELKSDSDK